MKFSFKFTLFHNTKIGKERGNSYQNNEDISRWKAHVNTQKHDWNVSMITDVFLNQKRVNVCEHTLNTAPHVFTYIYSLPIKKDICDHWNVSVMLPYVYVCLSSGDVFIFSVSFLFLFLFLCYSYLGSFLSMWMLFMVF